jgi:hypothetical protein
MGSSIHLTQFLERRMLRLPHQSELSLRFKVPNRIELEDLHYDAISNPGILSRFSKALTIFVANATISR